jgi:hypothetical protein
VHCVLPPRSSIIEHNILEQSWRKCSPELKINHYIVPFGKTDESFKQKDATGTARETASLTITINHSWLYIKRNWVTPYRWTWCIVRRFTMGKYFRITGSWPCWPVLLGLRRGLGVFPGHFFWYTYEQKIYDYLIIYDLEMNYREYQIYSSQKFSSNHSRRSQTSSSMVVLRTGRADPAIEAMYCIWSGWVQIPDPTQTVPGIFCVASNQNHWHIRPPGTMKGSVVGLFTLQFKKPTVLSSYMYLMILMVSSQLPPLGRSTKWSISTQLHYMANSMPIVEVHEGTRMHIIMTSSPPFS